MSKFTADIAAIRASAEENAYYNDQIRQGIELCLEDFPANVPAIAINWKQDESVDLIALPTTARDLIAPPVAWAILHLAYRKFVMDFEKMGIKMNEDGCYLWTRAEWTIRIHKNEVLQNMANLFFDCANPDDADFNGIIGAINLFLRNPRHLEIMHESFQDYAFNKWGDVMARKADEALMKPAPRKANWLERVVGAWVK